MNNEFPKYLKATDLDGNTIALLVIEAKERTTIIERNGALNRVSFRTVKDVHEADVGGQVVNIEADEYDQILYDQWKFDVSDAVLFAKAAANDEGEDDAEDTDLSGSDETAGSEGGEQAASGSAGFASSDGAAVAGNAESPDGTGDDGSAGTESDAGTDDQAAGDEPADAPASGDETADDADNGDDGVKDESAESQK